MSDERFSAEPVLDGLMGFQRETVEHVFSALHGEGGSDRFLVADETGLGKSIVARGLVAKTIERLQDDTSVDRIDIVYVCSNMDLARQNIGRLNVTGEQEVAFSSRLTLLGQHSARLNQREGRRTFHGKPVNLVSFTPSTSFDPGHQTGQARERALLVLVLEQVLGMTAKERRWTTNLLRASVSSVKSMRRYVTDMEADLERGIDASVLQEFAHEASTAPSSGAASLDEFRALLDEVMTHRGVTQVPRSRAHRIIGALRHDLAKAGIATLEPDLVILDEFQRFRPLLSRDNDAGALAHDLFSFPSARVVLLSATPYKPFTYAEEAEDHASDFLRTIRFLHEEPKELSPRTDHVAELLADYRRDVTKGQDATAAAAAASEALLRVMCRNERPLIEERSMLDVRLRPADRITADDLAGYVRLRQLADVVGPGAGLVGIDYWKSAPYFLTFCDGYRLRERIKDSTAPELPRALRAARHLTRADIDARRPIDLGNARIRRLADELTDSGLWRLLWMPPSLPYLTPSGPYAGLDEAEITKRLVFSAWTATPASVASLLSYEVDRLIHEMSAGGMSDRGQTLVYRGMSETGRPQSMTTLMTFWPMPGLARLTDPREHARDHGVGALEVFLADSIPRVRAEFDGGGSGGTDTDLEEAQRTWHSAFAHHSSWPRTREGQDAMVQAMAPTAKATAIDHQREQTEASRNLSEHVRYASELGASPSLRDEDVRILAEVGAFSPANISWRVLHRLFGQYEGVSTDGLMVAAAALAGGLRTLFNTPHATAIVRAAGEGGYELPQWRRILDYTAKGNLEAALEEWLFNRRNEVAREWSDATLLTFANDEAAAIGLRTSTLTAFDASAHGSDDPTIRFPMRFAVRYGARDARGGDDARMPEVRASFNSPFWPFLLVSTSVGQEGIDFHWWCHAILHWNTPPNPVDFEQREGRVDRFRGHAIRKNIAAKHGDTALSSDCPSPWPHLFELATDLRNEHGHFTPDWVYPGPAKIQRHLAPYAMSRDEEQYRKVERDVALYRLALGQPRQEDMVSLVRKQVEAGAKPARINLMPGQSID
ncbi:helicase [Janibacter cremeus]|uniref:Helicase ATP-binding domain-containing protein n=1 Tax=Janibacter cremeus TaxID=1285192 RepID=A0A852VIH4_9MICO|nr:helicase [Janibacter cremeus]NYF96897.1 hypothetical protein [Janibacter cremeus]